MMKKYLITGLVILLPVALTILIIGFIVNFLTRPFMGMVSHLLSQTTWASKGFLIFSPEQTLRYTSQFIILVCLFFAIFFLGMLARWYLVNWIIQLGEKILHRLPLVNKIYKTTKEIIVNFFGHGKNSFKQVVMVPFPKEGIYSIGFLSQPAPKDCSAAAEKTLISVFIPTAPNPTTGYVVMYEAKDIHFINMRPEEAIKYVVSCGMVAPSEEEVTVTS